LRNAREKREEGVKKVDRVRCPFTTGTKKDQESPCETDGVRGGGGLAATKKESGQALRFARLKMRGGEQVSVLVRKGSIMEKRGGGTIRGVLTSSALLKKEVFGGDVGQD